MQDKITDLYGNDDVEAMYQQALRVPLYDKIQMAIDLIRMFENQALSLSPDGYYVCFSGGKDSIVMAKLFEMAGVKYKLHINNVTIDPPELIAYVKKYWPDVTWHHPPEGNLPMYMKHKSNGPPTRLGRWCCAPGRGSFRCAPCRQSLRTISGFRSRTQRTNLACRFDTSHRGMRERKPSERYPGQSKPCNG